MEEIISLDITQNPLELKKKVASIIITQLHDAEKAKDALEKFENTFSKKEFPEDAQVVEASKEAKLGDVLVERGIVESKSEFRRLVEAGAVSEYPDNKITDPNELVQRDRKIKIGKKTFIQLQTN
jgi:tyrosyl-tRNA synthetase